MLRKLGVAENVLLEIPLPTSPPAPWDEVWNALTEARDTFEHGGSTGWKGCVTAVRLALDKWRQIEEEDLGPTDKQARTKLQRFENLRWNLLQYAHYGPHSRADEWTRDDALLMLAALSTLLAVRKP